MAIGEKLDALLRASGKRPGTLASEAGVSRNTVYSILKRNNEKVSLGILRRLAEALDVPVEVFFSDAPVANLTPVRRVRIPLLGGIAAGEPRFAGEEYGTYVDAGEDVDCSFALRVNGDSMEPTVRYGDLVFIRQQDDVDDGQIAAVLIDEDATLKRIVHIPGGLTLLSDNAGKYPPMTFTYPEHDTIRILGKAVAFKRML